jgi:hypothetical protein
MFKRLCLPIDRLRRHSPVVRKGGEAMSDRPDESSEQAKLSESDRHLTTDISPNPPPPLTAQLSIVLRALK